MSKATKKDIKVQEKVEENKEQNQAQQQIEEVQIQATKIETEGFGRFEYPNGIIYEGQWKLVNSHKTKHGEGTLAITGSTSNEGGNEEYKGEWVEDRMEGYGVYKYTSGAIYYGNWKNNKHNGKGTYEFPDGTLYEGEFKDHKMHSEGYYIDKLGNKWQGEFVNGIYQSKMQKELKIAKLMNKKEEEIFQKAKTIFEKFADAFAKSDKKTMKENLIPFFSIQDEVKLYVKEPYPKFEDKTPEKWNDIFKWLSEFTFSNVLRNQTNSKFLDPQNILATQFQNNGQIVEFMRETDQRSVKLAICNSQENNWTIVFFHDTEVEVKKK